MNNKMRDAFENSAYRSQETLYDVWELAWQAALAASQTCVAKPELPPLPEPTIEGSVMHEELKICYRTLVHFTADQMREYGQACADAAQRDKDGNHADDLRGWLDEAREQYESQYVAFHACSLKLKQAEEELADLRAALSASGQTAQAAMPEQRIADTLQELASAQKPLDADISKIVFDNLWALYGDEFSQKLAPQPSQVSEQDKLDAERYRWFRANHDEYVPDHPTKSLWGSKRNDYQLKKMGALDQAIDVAIASQPKPE